MVNEWKKRWNSHKGHEIFIWYLLGYLLEKNNRGKLSKNTGKLGIFDNTLQFQLQSPVQLKTLGQLKEQFSQKLRLSPQSLLRGPMLLQLLLIAQYLLPILQLRMKIVVTLVIVLNGKISIQNPWINGLMIQQIHGKTHLLNSNNNNQE